MKFNIKTISLIYETFLFVLALISVIFIWSNDPMMIFIDKMVWFIFFVDVCIRLMISNNKWQYVKSNPFDIIAAIPLDSIFQTARVIRLFRIVRLIAISKNLMPNFFKIIKTNGLDRALTISTIIIILSTLVITEVEPNINSYTDGLWWTIVTTTTVGYGDISPSTGLGRAIAVLLMLVGIGLIGMITGSITTFFVKDYKKEIPSVSFIQEQLKRFEELTPEEMEQLIILLEQLKQEKVNQVNETMNSKKTF